VRKKASAASMGLQIPSIRKTIDKHKAAAESASPDSRPGAYMNLQVYRASLCDHLLERAEVAEHNLALADQELEVLRRRVGELEEASAKSADVAQTTAGAFDWMTGWAAVEQNRLQNAQKQASQAPGRDAPSQEPPSNPGPPSGAYTHGVAWARGYRLGYHQGLNWAYTNVGNALPGKEAGRLLHRVREARASPDNTLPDRAWEQECRLHLEAAKESQRKIRNLEHQLNLLLQNANDKYLSGFRGGLKRAALMADTHAREAERRRGGRPPDSAVAIAFAEVGYFMRVLRDQLNQSAAMEAGPTPSEVATQAASLVERSAEEADDRPCSDCAGKGRVTVIDAGVWKESGCPTCEGGRVGPGRGA
jgi:hypothetical protein